MSFRERLSNFWNNVQYKLFPQLEQDLGELSHNHKTLVSVLELIRIEDFIPSTTFKDGRPPKDRAAIARAYVAKIVFKISFTKQLIEYLNTDKQLKEICGWDEYEKIPSEAKFCRVFKEFANSLLPEQVHQALIKEIYKDKIVCHVVKDSTAIIARERALKKGCAKSRKRQKDRERMKDKREGKLNLRQRQLEEKDLDKIIEDLPKSCDKGMKKSAQGYTMIWKGYKLHTAIDDNCIPLAAILTSASTNDCEVAIPLGKKSEQVVLNLYDLMDAAYDHPEIKMQSFITGRVPIIDKCPANKIQKIEKAKEKERRKSLNFQTAEDKRYKHRFSKERFHSLYKDFYGGRTIHLKGHKKVFCHVMFGVLVCAAVTLIRLVQ